MNQDVIEVSVMIEIQRQDVRVLMATAKMLAVFVLACQFGTVHSLSPSGPTNDLTMKPLGQRQGSLNRGQFGFVARLC